MPFIVISAGPAVFAQVSLQYYPDIHACLATLLFPGVVFVNNLLFRICMFWGLFHKQRFLATVLIAILSVSKEIVVIFEG